ncbi:MAG: peptidoglycan-binding domain-containing protein [Methylocystaceae bacterium]
MKAGKFMVLLLLVASAMVIGTTAGLIVGMNDANKAAANIKDTQTVVSSPKANTPASVPPTRVQTAAVTPASDSSTTDSSTAPRDLSGADIAQVETMLQSLGYDTAHGIVPAVQQYQEDNSLNATGALDMDTLQSMVDQIRLSRVKQLTSTKAS